MLRGKRGFFELADQGTLFLTKLENSIHDFR